MDGMNLLVLTVAGALVAPMRTREARDCRTVWHLRLKSSARKSPFGGSASAVARGSR